MFSYLFIDIDFVELQISFSGIVFPALLSAYSGQAAYLTKFPNHVQDSFYKSIPGNFSKIYVYR